MAITIAVATTIIITLRISSPVLRPLRQYFFSLKCPGAQKEKNDIQDEGNAGDNPDSCGAKLD